LHESAQTEYNYVLLQNRVCITCVYAPRLSAETIGEAHTIFASLRKLIVTL